MRRRVLAVAAVAVALPVQSAQAMTDPPSEPACDGSCAKRVQRRERNEARRDVVRPVRAWLLRLRHCESTNDYAAVDSSGMYTGAYQFDDQTWQAVGGRGRAMHASKLEQDYRAARLRKARGTAPWPVCGG